MVSNLVAKNLFLYIGTKKMKQSAGTRALTARTRERHRGAHLGVHAEERTPLRRVHPRRTHAQERACLGARASQASTFLACGQKHTPPRRFFVNVENNPVQKETAWRLN